MINPKKTITLGISALSIAAILVIAPLVSLIPVANAQEQGDISVTEPTRKLTVQWWQWIVSIPPEDNPLLDSTGEKCQEGNMGNIFFLVGTLGGSAVVRECTISEGQEIFFPIINQICIDKPGGFGEPPRDFDPPIGGPGSCQEQNESFIDQASDLEVTIDGVSIENLQDFRVQSYPFPLKAQEDNLLGALGVPPGTYIAISDGYWIVVESLPEGEHTIHFAGQVGDELTVDVTYHLTVE